ncbi:hypothetical protein OH738_00455 [Streptomyces hirsutus]|uniref:MmpS family membrane protein n=1 Tax=Streptomyces hirsutus TaxID=35620 RepID=A0ABZ1H1K2_9ACTN|nr:hypothetical protein [Streptomyces hirsutus]WSD11149.1 hypothetical protein OIE73_39510 [Streptomyces hirsutus]WTD15498.1 hypothetical protein OH738_00455 [Streptomyces hirsutus]WTD79475.1 hypothetical protein OHB56_40145 [Streptomyces sp. NBC_01635]
MRRATTITALIAAAGLMTACGSSGGDKKERADKGTSTSSKPAADGQDKTYEVTFKVGGEGKSSVYYNLDTNRSEQVTLPWKKSDKLTLNSTERKVGITVSIVPGPVKLSTGQYAAAPCSITVDGKKVAENPGGVDGKHMCEYTLR